MSDTVIKRKFPELSPVGAGKLGEYLNSLKITKAFLKNILQSLAFHAVKRVNICVVAITFTDSDTCLSIHNSNTFQPAITFRKVSDVHLNSISLKIKAIINSSGHPLHPSALYYTEYNVSVFLSDIPARHYAGRNIMITHGENMHACLGVNAVPQRVNINTERANTFPQRVNINPLPIMPTSRCFVCSQKPKLILIAFPHVRHAFPQIYNSLRRKYRYQTTMCQHVESVESIDGAKRRNPIYGENYDE